MSQQSSALALLMLSELPRVGEQGARRVWEFARQHGLDLAQALALPGALAPACRLPVAATIRLTSDRPAHVAGCRRLLTQLRAAGALVRDPAAPAYPRRWLRYARPTPAVAYLYGNGAALSAPTLAVLNSRDLTARGVTATLAVAQRAAAEGFTLVTGGMKSTHRIAAVAARATAAPHVIVLDRGLFAAFAGDLARDPFGFGPGRGPFDRQRILVLSPFRLNDHAAPRNGRRRDQLVAALADIIVAVSARPGGEIERTCLRALDGGQCVLSWLGENPGLVAAGATAIGDAELRVGLTRFAPRPR